MLRFLLVQSFVFTYLDPMSTSWYAGPTTTDRSICLSLWNYATFATNYLPLKYHSFFFDFSASNHHYNISHENTSFFFKSHKKRKVSQIPKKASPLVKKIKICLYYLILKGDTFFILGVTFCHQMIFKGDTFNFKDFVKIRPIV